MKPDDISDSHDDDYKDGCLLGCRALYSGSNWLTFQRCLLPNRPDDGGSKHPRNVSQFLPGYTAHHNTRQPAWRWSQFIASNPIYSRPMSITSAHLRLGLLSVCRYSSLMFCNQVLGKFTSYLITTTCTQIKTAYNVQAEFNQILAQLKRT
jgi:hypothetical protein